MVEQDTFFFIQDNQNMTNESKEDQITKLI